MFPIASLFLLLQKKIAKESDILKFEEEDIILKVGECLEARNLAFQYSSL